MLPRVLEPEVMDSADEARDYDAMDHRAVNTRFAADFLAADPDLDDILDVGTGTAQIPIELCRQAPAACVLGIDLAESMLELARNNIARAGCSGSVQVQRVDAKGLSFPSDKFSAVISNSIVHHIPDPLPVLAEMVRVVRPGGVLFVRDLLRPTDQATLSQLVQQYAGTASAHGQQMFAESLHAALTLAEIQAMVESLGFAPATVQRTTDRHWTWIARRA